MQKTRKPKHGKIEDLVGHDRLRCLSHEIANLAGSNIVELAPIGSGYDFVVHVKNVPTYGYNPEVPTDTAALGLRLARQYCRGPQDRRPARS